MRHGTLRTKIPALIVALQGRPKTVAELASLSGMSVAAVKRWTTDLERAGAIYATPAPVFGGPGLWPRAWRLR